MQLLDFLGLGHKIEYRVEALTLVRATECAYDYNLTGKGSHFAKFYNLDTKEIKDEWFLC